MSGALVNCHWGCEVSTLFINYKEGEEYILPWNNSFVCIEFWHKFLFKLEQLHPSFHLQETSTQTKRDKISLLSLFQLLLSQGRWWQGKINCWASSEPEIIQNDFLLTRMIEFFDISDKRHKSGLEAPLMGWIGEGKRGNRGRERGEVARVSL